MLYYKKKKIYTSIFYAILAMRLSVLSDNIVSSIITDGFQNGVEIKERFENDIVVYLIISIFILLLAFSISKLLGYLINRKRLIENVTANKKYGLILSSFLVLTFIFIYASVFVEKVSNPLLTIGIYVLYFLVIIIIVYFLITVTKKENEIINRKKELEQLSQYTKNLELLYIDMRKFRHDYINVLAALNGYIEDDNIEGLTEYFHNNIIPFSNKVIANNSELGLLSLVKIPEVKGIISLKIIYAQEKNIKVNIEISEEIDEINIETLDLCRILGILLDNAIESATNTENAALSIACINNPFTISIVIANSFFGEIPSINRMFTEGFSTKGEGRGLGLSTLREIVNSYTQTTLETIIENNEFRQVVRIRKKPFIVQI